MKNLQFARCLALLLSISAHCLRADLFNFVDKSTTPMMIGSVLLGTASHAAKIYGPQSRYYNADYNKVADCVKIASIAIFCASGLFKAGKFVCKSSNNESPKTRHPDIDNVDPTAPNLHERGLEENLISPIATARNFILLETEKIKKDSNQVVALSASQQSTTPNASSNSQTASTDSDVSQYDPLRMYKVFRDNDPDYEEQENLLQQNLLQQNITEHSSQEEKISAFRQASCQPGCPADRKSVPTVEKAKEAGQHFATIEEIQQISRNRGREQTTRENEPESQSPVLEIGRIYSPASTVQGEREVTTNDLIERGLIPQEKQKQRLVPKKIIAPAAASKQQIQSNGFDDSFEDDIAWGAVISTERVKRVDVQAKFKQYVQADFDNSKNNIVDMLLRNRGLDPQSYLQETTHSPANSILSMSDISDADDSQQSMDQPLGQIPASNTIVDGQIEVTPVGRKKHPKLEIIRHHVRDLNIPASDAKRTQKELIRERDAVVDCLAPLSQRDEIFNYSSDESDSDDSLQPKALDNQFDSAAQESVLQTPPATVVYPVPEVSPGTPGFDPNTPENQQKSMAMKRRIVNTKLPISAAVVQPAVSDRNSIPTNPRLYGYSDVDPDQFQLLSKGYWKKDENQQPVKDIRRSPNKGKKRDEEREASSQATKGILNYFRWS